MTQPDYRAALSQPQPPAGEVGELVAWLLDEAEQAANSDSPVAAGMLTWAAQVAGEHADLLEQLAQSAPQPIPVTERLPEAGDCDAEGRCWAWRKLDRDNDDDGDLWQLIPAEWLPVGGGWTHWLSCPSLPLPDQE